MDYNLHFQEIICKIGILFFSFTAPLTYVNKFHSCLKKKQRYTYRVLETIQMKLILLCVWAALKLL